MNKIKKVNKPKKFSQRKGKKAQKRARKESILKPHKYIAAHEIEIVSRQGQPQVTAKVPSIAKTNMPVKMVSSSWIMSLGYDAKGEVATMNLSNGYSYAVYIPWDIMTQWIYAHSKGTFFNEVIKGQYKVVKR